MASEHSVIDETPVAIVGGGPTGMFLALDLARHGIRSTLIEQSMTSLSHPKGSTHNSRTMEHYRRIGLAKGLRQLEGLPLDQRTDVVYMTRLDGYEMGRLEMPSEREKIAARDAHGPTDQVVEPLHRINQMYVERFVHHRVLDEKNVTALYGWTYVDRVDTERGIRLRICREADGEERFIDCRYLIGADGPRSPIRRELGTTYVGQDAFDRGFMGGPMRAIYIRIPAVYERFIKRRGWSYNIINAERMFVMIDVNGKDEFLIQLPADEDSTPEQIRDFIRTAANEDFEVEILASRPWIAGRALVTERYGDDQRVFIAGDAAHLFVPAGGFGMNTGVEDAANLAWKLAATLRGWGGPGLMSTYETERRPVGVRNTGAARSHAISIRDIPLDPAIDSDTAEGAASRARVGEVIPRLKEEFASLGVQLGARYDGSPLIAAEPGETPPPDDVAVYTPTSLPGGRAPHLWLVDGSSLFDHFGKGFTLLRFDRGVSVDALVAEAVSRRVPLTLLDIDLPAARTLYPRKLALVRPDQYLAWRGDTIDDPGALLSMVTGWTVPSTPAEE